MKESEVIQSNFIWADKIRVFATIAVVISHSAAPILLYKYNEIENYWWWTGNIYASLLRACVPLFVMLSGALLLNKQEPLTVFFEKRIKAVAIPLVIWSAIYLGFGHLYRGTNYSIGGIIRLMFSGRVTGHYT